MMEIRSLANTGFDTLFKGFAEAFAEYDLQLDSTQFGKMLKRRGCDPGLSFAAFEDSRIVAFTLNGAGDYNGIPTAYDTGTGTLKEFRGKGLATKIFEYSIPHLKEAGVRQYLLEVLQHNTKAVSVYRNLGFKVTREFNYFMQAQAEIGNGAKNGGLPCSIRPLSIGGYASIPDFGDFPPSWQNSAASIARAPEAFTGLGAFSGGRLIGYCVFEPASGDVTQIAVEKGCRRQGIGSLLFREAVKLNESKEVKIVNTDISCEAITRFLEEKNIHPKGKQFEMIKTL